jgi:hypothetical protein
MVEAQGILMLDASTKKHFLNEQVPKEAAVCSMSGRCDYDCDGCDHDSDGVENTSTFVANTSSPPIVRYWSDRGMRPEGYAGM